MYQMMNTATFRTGWTKSDIVACLHGGAVDEPHGHEDNGTFMLDALGERWICELPKEDYNLSKRVCEGATTELVLPKSNVIKYISKENEWAVLRPSGTEPKLKVYFSVKGNSHENALEKIEAFKKSMLEVVEGVE